MSPDIMITQVTLKCNKIKHIVRLRQMLRKWRKNASSSSSPSDVPSGHVAVRVGSKGTRYVVRATYLNHPFFRNLLVQAEEEFGFAVNGPLTIPCEESVFMEILRSISGNSSRFINLEGFKRCCHVDLRNNRDVFVESRPLLRG